MIDMIRNLFAGPPKSAEPPVDLKRHDEIQGEMSAYIDILKAKVPSTGYSTDPVTGLVRGTYRTPRKRSHAKGGATP